MAKVFIRVIASFLVALGITVGSCLLIIMYDPEVRAFLEQQICTQSSAAFDCNFTARVAQVDLLQGAITLTDVVVLPPSGTGWFWTADTITIKISWSKLFNQKEAHLIFIADDMHLHSSIEDGTLAIAGHITAFTRERAGLLPIIPQVYIPKARISLKAGALDPVECTLVGAIELKGDKQHLEFMLKQEKLMYKDQVLIKDLKVSIKKVTDTITKKGPIHVNGTLDLRDPFNESFHAATIKAELAADTQTIVLARNDQALKLQLSHNDNYTCLLETPLGMFTVTTAGQADAFLTVHCVGSEPASIAVTYQKESDHVAFMLRDDQMRATRAMIYFDGRYELQGATDFFYELLKKLPENTLDNTFKYRELLGFKTPFTLFGGRFSKHWSATLDVSELQVRIPYTYNFLRSVHTTAHYYPQDMLILFKQTALKTDRGTLHSGLSTCILDGDTRHIQSAHIPFTVQDFFINYAKDFFAHLSGAFVINYYKDERSKIQGVCTIKKCHIRNNPFAGGVGGAVVSAALNAFVNHPLAKMTDIDLLMQSYEPVDIKTDFLKGRAHIKVQALGNLVEPQLYGSLEIVNGSFNFPYKPLEIQYGKIFFVNNELDDPAIELSATANIKNYSITMHVHGTARHPIITFHSLPSLQEEQIIGLLLGGSPDNSLSLVMPFSSAGLIEKLIVGGNAESSGLLDTFKGWLRPLEKVKIVPRFSDQTSRGGLRGALAVEVNDTLSGLIQQNFSLSEDTLIEVAYKPFDELIIRSMRDERGDFGGEIETCFKW